MILPDIKNAEGEHSFNALAALAARDSDGDVLISLVHRGATGPIRALIHVQGLPGESKALLQTLSGQTPWSANTLEQPHTIQLVQSQQAFRDGEFTLLMQPFSVV